MRGAPVSSGNAAIPFPDEIARLAIINDRLKDAWKKANESVDRMDRAYMDAKRCMAQNRGEIGPHEMFQNELVLKQLGQTGAFAVSAGDKPVGGIRPRIDMSRRNEPASLGILTRTERDARKLCSLLSGEQAVHLIAPASTRFADGIPAASLRMSKGIQFDEIIIPDAASETCHTQHDGRLLYAARTGDMRRPILFHVRKRSRRIGRQGEGDG